MHGPEAERDELAASGLFDRSWYLEAYPDVREAGLEPIDHYCGFGWREGRKPTPYFNGTWYLAQYGDVRQASMNPLLHYLRHGEREGRRPIPAFDPAWYRTAYGLPAGELALRHFLLHRLRGLVALSPELYAVPHLACHAGEIAAGRDPFLHYLSDAAGGLSPASPDPPLVANSGLFDANYYLLNGSDVHEADVDPVTHFCRWGWKERRNPNIYFDTSWYLKTNPEVSRCAANPLVHYILKGENADRRPVVYFDPSWYRATYGVPKCQSALAHYLANRRGQNVSPNPIFDVSWYLRRYGTAIGPDRDVFAHYLQAGTFEDVHPSPNFDAVEYRRRHIGRPSRLFSRLVHPQTHNPLVHFLRTQFL